MDFRILGLLEASDGGRLIDLGRPKQRAVLAILLVSANRVVSQDRLIDLLWGEAAPPTSVPALQVYISNLRRALEPDRAARSPAKVLLTRSPGYVLRVGPDELDAARFEALATTGHQMLAQGRLAAARAALVEALALWRGPALAEFAFGAFAQGEAARLEELAAVATEARLEADLALGGRMPAWSPSWRRWSSGARCANGAGNF